MSMARVTRCSRFDAIVAAHYPELNRQLSAQIAVLSGDPGEAERAREALLALQQDGHAALALAATEASPRDTAEALQYAIWELVARAYTLGLWLGQLQLLRLGPAAAGGHLTKLVGPPPEGSEESIQ